MKQIKIIFFDVDGTLIDIKRKKITPKVVEMLCQLQEKGTKIVIATGRSPIQLPKFEGVNFDAYLTFNGSLCFIPDEPIFSNPLAKQDVYQLLANANQLQKPMTIATQYRNAANGLDTDLQEYYGFGGIELTVAPDFDDILQKETIYQVLMPIKQAQYEMALHKVQDAKITAWWDRAVDIIPKNGGKGRRIQAILDYYGLTKEEAMAFGDGNNDIAMFEAVGHAVAMDNASDDLKAVSHAICGDVADDGVYTYCKAIGLID